MHGFSRSLKQFFVQSAFPFPGCPVSVFQSLFNQSAKVTMAVALDVWEEGGWGLHQKLPFAVIQICDGVNILLREELHPLS